MTLRARLALGFLLLTGILFLPLGIVLRSIEQIESATDSLRLEEVNASLLLSRVRESVAELGRAELLLAGVPGTEGLQYTQDQLTALRVYARQLRRLELDELGATIERSAERIAKFAPLVQQAMAANQGTLAEKLSDTQIQPAIADIEVELQRAQRTVSARAFEKVRQAGEVVSEVRRVSALVVAGAGSLALLVAIWLTRSVARPVRDLERGMEAVAAGRFSHRLGINPSREDEFGRLARSYRSMADQLAELERIRAEFVSVASHELKTPINVIVGYVQLLEEQLYGPMNDKQLEVLGVLETQAGALARLVQHLLDVSRFRAGGARLDPRPLPLRAFLDQQRQTFSVLAVQRELTFDVHPADSLPDTVVWDADRISEVLGNLLSNAFKFTSAGGKVVLAARSSGEHVTIEVRDTGAGIAPAQLRHIFDKFFQADNQAAADAKGSGLGLAIAKELVQAHGGSISVESTVGEGTCFSVVLPTDVRAVVTRRSGTSPAHQNGAGARGGDPRPATTLPTPPPAARTS